MTNLWGYDILRKYHRPQLRAEYLGMISLLHPISTIRFTYPEAQLGAISTFL